MEGEMAETGDAQLQAMQTALKALMSVEEADRQAAFDWLAHRLGVKTSVVPLAGQVGGTPAATPPGAPAANLGSLTPKQFIDLKKPTTDVERVTCLAYYLTHSRGTAYFKTRALSELNTEAAAKKLSNAAKAAGNAVRANLLASAPQRQRQISAYGERYVEALPDREKVNAVVAEGPKQSRGKGSSKAKKSKKATTKKA
jgi:hypothetical protein